LRPKFFNRRAIAFPFNNITLNLGGLQTQYAMMLKGLWTHQIPSNVWQWAWCSMYSSVRKLQTKIYHCPALQP